MENFIIIAILILTVGCAIYYIVKKKKSGAKCIGCPNSEGCSKCNCQQKSN